MTDTPEKIWAWHFLPKKQNDVMKGGWDDAFDKKSTEYHHDDTVKALQARIDELEELLRRAQDIVPEHSTYWRRDTHKALEKKK